MSYDPEYDLLRIVIDGERPAISVDIDGVWMRLEPTTGEILGFEFQDFLRSFLPKHPDLVMSLTNGTHEHGQPVAAEPVGWVRAFFALIQRTAAASGTGDYDKLSLAQ